MIRAVQKAQDCDEIGEDELQELEKDVEQDEEDSSSEGEGDSMADVEDMLTSTN